jgi:hypothetical protein
MVLDRSVKRKEYQYKKCDLKAVKDESIFFKKRIEDYETDEDDQI